MYEDVLHLTDSLGQVNYYVTVTKLKNLETVVSNIIRPYTITTSSILRCLL